MRTTIDLPAPLLVEAKVRAAKENRKLKDVISEAVELGLQSMTSPEKQKEAKIVCPEDGSLPFIDSLLPDVENGKVSVKDILRIEQETQSEEDLRRAGITN